MSRIRIAVLLLTLIALMVGSVGISNAAPCQPCSTWGQIKSCFGTNPDPCCDCTKDITVDGIVYYLGALIKVELYEKSLKTSIENMLKNALRINNECECNDDFDMNSLATDK